MNVLLIIFCVVSLSCYGMKQEIDQCDNKLEIVSKEQGTTAPSLDGVRILQFVADALPQEMQEPFVQKITVRECVKIATNFEKDHADLYKKAMNVITNHELLSEEKKSEFLIQLLAYGFMYRSVKSKKHKEDKVQSDQKAQAAQKTSIGTIIVSSAITVITNLLQHFLTKK